MTERKAATQTGLCLLAIVLTLFFTLSAEAHGSCKDLNGKPHPPTQDGTHDGDGDGIGCELNANHAIAPAKASHARWVTPLAIAGSLILAGMIGAGFMWYWKRDRKPQTDTSTDADAADAADAYATDAAPIYPYADIYADIYTDTDTDTDDCECGQPLRGNIDKCEACQEYPNRIPGTCTRCGHGCRRDFAICLKCKQKEANPSAATRLGIRHTRQRSSR